MAWLEQIFPSPHTQMTEKEETTAAEEKAPAATTDADAAGEDAVVESADVHFEPVVKLEQLAEIKTNEEEEESLFKMYHSFIHPH